MEKDLHEQLLVIVERGEYYQTKVKEIKKDMAYALESLNNVNVNGIRVEMEQLTRDLTAYVNYLNTMFEEVGVIRAIAIKNNYKDLLDEINRVQDSIMIVK